MTIDLVQISIITSVLVEVIKKTPLNRFVENWLQVIAIIISAIFAVIYGYSVVEGIIAGFAAMGLYDITKFGINRVR